MRGLSSFFGHRIPVARIAEPICAQCRIQVRSSGRHPEQISQQWRSSRQLELSRSFHGTKWNLQNLQGGSTPQGSKEASSTDPTVHRVPDEKLPSHRIQQRWNLSKKFHLLMDDLMKNLAIAGQQINTYTGTDYSGIAALRNEIKEQEQLVKSRHAALRTAKQDLELAQEQRTKSSSELVALLERKHSWASTDLERYMSLMRSEHNHDQAVQKAKDSVMAAEQSLEEARTRLEKRERSQYHEEQIWSDTIRRNSTWVTFGLMGFNVLLLLANVIAIEPWRRRKMVREIKTALDEKTMGGSAIEDSATADIKSIVEDIEKADASQLLATKTPELDPTRNVPTSPIIQTPAEPEPSVESFQPWTKEAAKGYIKRLFSESPIVIRRYDLTTVALQSAATGAAITVLLAALLIKPR